DRGAGGIRAALGSCAATRDGGRRTKTSGNGCVRCGRRRRAQAGFGALAKLHETQDSAYTHSCFYNLKSAIELATRKPEDAEESQRRAAVYLPFFSAYEGLASALEAQHKWKEAAQAYQRFLDFKGEVISDDSPAYWVVANLRLARVLAQDGEQKEA